MTKDKLEETNKEYSKIILSAMLKRYTMIEQRDLYMLVQFAIIHEEITVSKAAELLGIPIEDMRSITQGWLTEPEEHNVILPE